MQTIGPYTVEVYRDTTYTEGSSDNTNDYLFVYFNQDDYVSPTMLGIKVFKGSELLASAIIGSTGGGTGVHEHTIIYENTRILMCCSDTIFCLSIPDLKLLWETKADQATCFAIYPYEDNYIVHGEMEISRLDYDGSIIWQNMGADIFTTLDGKETFQLTDNYILAKDFENNLYKFDYNGNVIQPMVDDNTNRGIKYITSMDNAYPVLIKSKFRMGSFITLILPILSAGLLVLFTKLILTSASPPLVYMLFVATFSLVGILLPLGHLRNRAHKVHIDPHTIYVSNYYGLGTLKKFRLSEMDGFITSILTSRSGLWEYLYLIKDGKNIITISQFDHSNYEELKTALVHKVTNLGVRDYSMLREMKEVFKR